MYRLFKKLYVPLYRSYQSIHNYSKTSEYQIKASFCIGVSTFGSFCDSLDDKISSHHENIIFMITKGVFIGLTYPISFPTIASVTLYNKYFKSSSN